MGQAGDVFLAVKHRLVQMGNRLSMVVLERPLKKVYEEIDLVATPAGKPVAMVHCNNCTNDTLGSRSARRQGSFRAAVRLSNFSSMAAS